MRTGMDTCIDQCTACCIVDDEGINLMGINGEEWVRFPGRKVLPRKQLRPVDHNSGSFPWNNAIHTTTRSEQLTLCNKQCNLQCNRGMSALMRSTYWDSRKFIAQRAQRTFRSEEGSDPV